MMKEKLAKVKQRLKRESTVHLSIKSEGIYRTELSVTVDGCLCVALHPDEGKMERYRLLLQESKGEKRTIEIEGFVKNDVIRFDLSSVVPEDLWTSVSWGCYLFGVFGEKTWIRELCSEESIDWTTSAQAEGAFPSSCLWQDSGRCLGEATRLKREDGEYELVFLPDAETGVLRLQWFSCSYGNLLLQGELFHHAKGVHQQEHPYMFSVVMAVYNVESYVEEAIDSILQQDIGFEENVQLILVDDGSTDQSGEICDAYAENYPDNIIALHQKNGGVAAARNAGKERATGKYVNFLDADDKFTPNVLRLVKDFFDRNYDRVDVVTIPIMHFGAKDVSHWQNDKFEKGNRVINLWTVPTASCMFANASFYKAEAITEYKFDGNLPSAEDCKFNLQILMDKMTLGVVVGGWYWYRRREEEDSLTNTRIYKKTYYDKWFSEYAYFIMHVYQKQYGFIPQFVQNMIMMDLQWRFVKENIPEGVLTADECQQYRKILCQTIRQIDDSLILNQKKIYAKEMLQILCMKYETAPTVLYFYNNAHIFCHGILVRPVSKLPAYFDFIRLENGCLHLEGYLSLFGFPEDADVSVYVSVCNTYYPCKAVERELVNHNAYGNLRETYGFSVNLPISTHIYGEKIRMSLVVDGHLIVNWHCSYGKFCPVTNQLENQYCYLEQGLVLSGYKDGLVLEKATKSRTEYEEGFLAALKRSMEEQKKMNQTFPRPVMPDTLTLEKYEEIMRLRKYAIEAKKTRPIWIISDRATVADDNGAALFKYLMQQKDLPVDIYFLIKKDCPDFEKMAAVGPVLEWGSEKHLRTHLIADMVISSQFNDFVFTPFCKDTTYYGDRIYYADLLHEQKFVFLRHGICVSDMSPKLNRYAKNIAGLVATTEQERAWMLQYPYGYEESKVWLTGLPRHDYLYEDSKKQITFMPTWREFLTGLTEQQFELTEFYQFYKAVFSSSKLLQFLEQKGYRLCVKLHPEFMKYNNLFERLGIFVLNYEEPYRKIYAESDLIITDYSSAAMDYSLLRKPVIYCQFDQEEFRKWQYAATEFSYEEDGFGPVVKTPEEAVEQIVAVIENDCRIEQKYLDRCNAFFPENDHQNCERVYRKILDLSNT